MPVHRVVPYSEAEEKVAGTWIAAMNSINVALYQLSDGRVAGRIPSGLPLLLLTAPGRTTGRPRTVTVAYGDVDGAFVVIGSNGGLSRDPAWVANALAAGHVRVQIGAERFRCEVEQLDPEAASAAIGGMAEHYAAFDDYGVRSGDRVIPVLRLTPVEEPAVNGV